MKYAIMADIHANVEALWVVWEDIQRQGADAVYHLGDLVGYGPNPNETVEFIMNKGIEGVMGNHDEAVISGDTGDFNKFPRMCLEWTRAELKPKNIEYLKNMNYSIPEFDDQQRMIRLVHANPVTAGQFGYIYSPGDAKEAFLTMEKDETVFLGHTHSPLVIPENKSIFAVHEGVVPLNDGRNLIGVGSVGQPRDCDPRACYAIYDSKAREVEFRRLDYDIEKTALKLENTSLNPTLRRRLAQRLREGK